MISKSATGGDECVIYDGKIYDAVITSKFENGRTNSVSPISAQSINIENGEYSVVLERTENTPKTDIYCYTFSLPFDCKISDIYGIAGRYFGAWGIQCYSGEDRAKEGWFKEDSKNFWRWMGSNETLKAGEGYSLSIQWASQTESTVKMGFRPHQNQTFIMFYLLMQHMNASHAMLIRR